MSKPGELLEVLTLQRKQPQQNEYGEEVLTWASVADRFGSVEDMPAREKFYAQRAMYNPSHTVTIRRDDDLGIDTTWRILWAGNTLHIAAMGSDRDYFTFDCEVANGS